MADLSWRFIVGAICLVLAAGGIFKNIEHGIPDNAPPGFIVGLYTPATVLILVGLWLIVSEIRQRKDDA